MEPINHHVSIEPKRNFFHFYFNFRERHSNRFFEPRHSWSVFLSSLNFGPDEIEKQFYRMKLCDLSMNGVRILIFVWTKKDKTMSKNELFQWLTNEREIISCSERERQTKTMANRESFESYTISNGIRWCPLCYQCISLNGQLIICGFRRWYVPKTQAKLDQMRYL